MMGKQTFKRILPSGCSVTNDSTFDWQAHFSHLGKKANHSLFRDYFSIPPVAPDTPLGKVQMLSLDLETTGMDASRRSIVSIGYIPFDYHRIYCKGAKNMLVKPDSPLSGKSTTFHNILHSDVEDAPKITACFKPMLEALSGKIMVVHYNGIEREFLSAAAKRHYNEDFEFPMIDTLVLEAGISRRKKIPWFNKWFKNQAHPSLRLHAARTRYGLPEYRPHHALTDALGTAELLQAQLQTHFSPDTPISEIWL